MQCCTLVPTASHLHRFPAAASVLRSAKELLHSRAYLRFKDAADVPRFQQAWDGHAFVNERGTQFRCGQRQAARRVAASEEWRVLGRRAGQVGEPAGRRMSNRPRCSMSTLGSLPRPGVRRHMAWILAPATPGPELV